MIYLLDTNACIQYLNGQSPSIKARIEQLKPEDICLCSVVKAELLFGAAKGGVGARTLARLKRIFDVFASLPFDDRAAAEYGVVRAELERRGTPIGPNDLLIASIAIAHAAILVTHNSREFARIAGLKIEDWQ